MASYSPSHTLSQLLVFVLLITAALGAAAWRCSGVWCWGLHTHPINGTCSLPLPRSSSSTGQSKQMAAGDQSKMGRESGKGHLLVPGGQERPSCAGCSLWSPGWSALVPLSERADSDQAGSSKTELTQIPRFLAHYFHFVMQMFICPSQLS